MASFKDKEKKKMKKVIALTAIAVLLVGSVFAMDMSIGVKGIIGTNNSGINGTAIGGGVDITLDLYNGWGFRTGSDIITSKISKDDGLTFTKDFNVNIPVMAWYDYNSKRFGIGGGLGLGCNIGSSVKFTLTAGLETRYNINEQFSLFLGVNGNLDVFPTLTREDKGDSSSYKFVKSDFSKNNIYGSIGVRYNIDLSN